MNVISIVALCLITVVICKILERNNKEISMITGAFAAVYVLMLIAVNISGISETIESLFTKADISYEYMDILFKAVGISYLTQLGSDCCKDCGESAIATEIELFGKVSVLLISLPVYTAVISLIEELLN